MYFKLENLHNKNVVELIQILKSIPKDVTTLDLSGNSLDERTSAELAQILAAIPPTVASLGLKNSQLQMLRLNDFIQLQNALPKLHTIYLDYHENPS